MKLFYIQVNLSPVNKLLTNRIESEVMLDGK